MADEREGRPAPGGPAARVQSGERRSAHRDRRGGTDRQPAARRSSCTRSRSWRAFPGRSRSWPPPIAGTPAAVAGVRGGDEVTAVDGVPIASLQDLRWQLLQTVGPRRHPHRCAHDRRAAKRRASSAAFRQIASSDWEGPFMQKLGLAADFGTAVDRRGARREAGRARGLASAATGSSRSTERRCARRWTSRPRPTRSRVPSRVPDRARPRNLRRAGDHRSHRIGGTQDRHRRPRLKVDPVDRRTLGDHSALRPVRALAEGVRKTWELSVFTVKMLGAS